jgi:hypothetical protein
MGIGIQSSKNVHSPMADVSILGWKPKGGGYTASSTSKVFDPS